LGSISPVSDPADHHRVRWLSWRIALVGGAGEEELAMSLYEKILKERGEEGYRRDVYPIVRYYVENGVR
jgi:hypothetical protein